MIKLAALMLAGAFGPVAALAQDFDVEETIWLHDSNVLSCAPDELRPGGKLVLTLGPGHGKELAIFRASDKTWLLLIVQQPPADMKLLMSRADFAAATRVEIPAESIGYSWSHDGGEEPIFTSAGRYIVYSSETLESETGGHTCTINYVP